MAREDLAIVCVCSAETRAHTGRAEPFGRFTHWMEDVGVEVQVASAAAHRRSAGMDQSDVESPEAPFLYESGRLQLVEVGSPFGGEQSGGERTHSWRQQKSPDCRHASIQSVHTGVTFPVCWYLGQNGEVPAVYAPSTSATSVWKKASVLRRKPHSSYSLTVKRV